MSLRRFAWFLFASLLLIATSPHAQLVDSNFVAHFPFDGSVDDDAPNNHSATTYGAPAFSTGLIGRSVYLDGNDDAIEFPTIAASKFAGDFTIAFFVRLPALGAYGLVDKRSSCFPGNWFEIRTGLPNADSIAFQLSTSTQAASAVGRLEANRWTHVAAVRAGNVARLYLDGKSLGDVALPALSLGAITAPLGVGTSPCIGRGLSRPDGRMDELRVYSRALSGTEVQKIAARPGFSVTPRSASPGATLAITATHLTIGNDYELVLKGARDETLLMSVRATTTTHTWKPVVPSIATGDYMLQLRAATGRLRLVLRDAPFTVVPKLTLVPSSTTPQAGKGLLVDVGGLVPGAVRLVYGNRIVAGPASVDGSTKSLKFVLPTDYPTSFPASVLLRAELLDGKVVARIGTRTLTVSAPHTGAFVIPTALSSSTSTPRTGTKVRVGATLELKDETLVGDVETSAFWIGDNGTVTPLPTSAMTIASDGKVLLDTYPPSLASMTANTARGPGHIRLVTRRVNKVTGLVENVVTEGPPLTTVIDTDPQTDITVTVRAVGNGSPVALEGAYVIVDAAAPIQLFSPPAPPAGGTTAGYSTSGVALLENSQPQRELGASRPALNQVTSTLGNIQLPPPECGTNLRRRYTDANGRAEFLIQGGPEDAPAGMFELAGLQYQQNACSGVACNSAIVLPTYTFYMTIYTLHLGAGERKAGQTDEERPTRLKIEYDRSIERFTITNLKTGTTTVQNVSANITVDVPLIAQLGGLVTIGDPAVFQQVGTSTYFVPRTTDNGFGKWIDFGGTQVSSFLNGAPDRVIRFPHRPDAAGSIVSAKLYLTNLVTGAPSFVGDFQQISFANGCQIQDDPNDADTEAWELRITEPLAQHWRFPRGIFFLNDATVRKACGYIEARNRNGGVGKRSVCFEWQAAPEYFQEASGALRVDDSDPNNVLVEVSGQNLADRSTGSPAPPPLNGEDVDLPGEIDNRSNSTRSTFDVITATGSAGATRRFTGNNPDQFSRTAGGRSEANDFASGATTLEIGEDEFQEIFDQTIPLFQWYWGVPEILSAEVYASLRIIASYYFHGVLTKTNGKESLDLTTDALFAVLVTIGVDIDVLFGIIVDAGASITGNIISEIPVVIEDGQTTGPQPCFTIKLDFNGYVDPCTFCPTPVIEFGDTILEHKEPSNCGLWTDRPKGSDLAQAKALQGTSSFGFAEARALRRHPALAFDKDGAGHALSLDSTGALKATQMSSGGAGASSVLSSAPGARQSKIAYYDSGKAIAVWHESALSKAAFPTSDYRTLARNQRLAYSTWDGESWSAAAFLTAPGTGEAHLALAACPADDAGCPEGGEVFAVWQRNESGDAQAPRHRLKYSRYVPGEGWTAVADVAPNASLVQDITPAATYVGSRPTVVWSRQTTVDLNDFTRRRLAYRMIGAAADATVITALPAGAVAPSIVESGSGFRIAYLRTIAGEGPIGTQLALHVASATCILNTCNFTGQLAKDEAGRAIYGERPQLVKAGNETSIVMRTFRFDDGNGSPVRAGDAIGTILSSGDLMALQTSFTSGTTRAASISADGAMHFGHTAAFNPATESVVTAATTYVPPAFVPLRSALKKAGSAAVEPMSRMVATLGDVEVRAMPAAPDFAVESLTTSPSNAAPGASVTATILLVNRGLGYVASRDGAATMQLRWDMQESAPIASVAIADLAAGAARIVTLQYTVPANGHPDESHALHAVVAPDESLVELTGTNNVATRELAGLPVPQAIASSTTPGIATVQLGWEPITDARVAGYRIYRLEGDEWLPLGSSPTHGFLDLSASFDVPRTYAVSTYSARGVEGERSEAITVMPTLLLANDLFLDGFENVQ